MRKAFYLTAMQLTNAAFKIVKNTAQKLFLKSKRLNSQDFGTSFLGANYSILKKIDQVKLVIISAKIKCTLTR